MQYVAIKMLQQLTVAFNLPVSLSWCYLTACVVVICLDMYALTLRPTVPGHTYQVKIIPAHVTSMACQHICDRLCKNPPC